MAKSPTTQPLLTLADSQLEELVRITRRQSEERRRVDRAKIILALARFSSYGEVAADLGISQPTARKWHRRFLYKGIEGLADAPRPGRPAIYTPEQRVQLIALACATKPEYESQWSFRLLAEQAREKIAPMSLYTVHQILEKADLKPHKVEEWLHSKDPLFDEKQADILSLYLTPPNEDEVVLCFDEKTSIQALSHKPLNMPMKPGSPEKVEFEYKRNGTRCLLAFFEVHTGKVFGQCTERHTHVEFLGALEQAAKLYPTQQVHVILDNLSVHSHAKVKEWLADHERFQFHFTPTHASWLNQIEIWFGILTRKLLRRGEFGSVQELADRISGFIGYYNEKAHPFRWTYTGEPLRA